MALISLREATLLKGTGSRNSDGKKDTEQRHFFLSFDAKPADRDAILAAGVGAGMPDIGNVFKTGDARICTKQTPSCNGSVLDYTISDQDYNENPLSRPDVVSGDFSKEKVTYFLDCSDTPLPMTNVLGEPFSELPKRDRGVFKCTVTGNRATVPAADWAAYFYPATAVNSGAITIRGINFGDQVLKLDHFRYAPKVEKSYKFFECEWDLAVSPAGWDDKFENRGFYCYDAGSIVPITLDDGVTRPSAPWPISDPTGTKLAYTDTPPVLTRKPYPNMTFSVFNFTP